MTEAMCDSRKFLSRRIRYRLIFGLERILRLLVTPTFRVVEADGDYSLEYRDLVPLWRPFTTMWDAPLAFTTRSEAEEFRSLCEADVKAAKLSGEPGCREFARSRIPTLFHYQKDNEPVRDVDDYSHGDAEEYLDRTSLQRFLQFTPRFRIVERDCKHGFKFHVETRGAFTWTSVRRKTAARVAMSESSITDAEGFVALCVENFVEENVCTDAERRERTIRRDHMGGRPNGYPKRIKLPHEMPI